MEPLLEGLLRNLGGSAPPPPELPRSPSRSLSSREAGWRIV